MAFKINGMQIERDLLGFNINLIDLDEIDITVTKGLGSREPQDFTLEEIGFIQSLIPEIKEFCKKVEKLSIEKFG
jgi:hypothetical protein